MIHTEGLTRRFADTLAVDRLDLDVGAGEMFGFLGPNGAGKTTTIRMLTGLLAPSAGRIEIGGIDLAEEPLAAKRLLGYIPDQAILYDKLTCRELMELVAGLYRMDGFGLGERIEQLLADFELERQADQLIESLSHGMKQKLSFASTFLHEPQVVVIDEPWVGLDPRSLRRIKRFLQEQTAAGKTIFLSTHTLSLAEELADKIGIIHRGRLLHVGTVPEIKALAARPGSLEDVFLELTEEDG